MKTALLCILLTGCALTPTQKKVVYVGTAIVIGGAIAASSSSGSSASSTEREKQFPWK